MDGDGNLPSLGAAGCGRLANRAEITYVLDRQTSDATLPLDAFEARLKHSFDMVAGQTPKLDLADSKARLPILFSPERSQAYVAQYEAADLVVKGARVYTDAACKNVAKSPVALFASAANAPRRRIIRGRPTPRCTTTRRAR